MKSFFLFVLVVISVVFIGACPEPVEGICENQCQLKETLCADGKYKECLKDEYNCMVWGDEKSCPEGFCETEKKCGVCQNQCQTKDLIHCQEGVIKICMEDTNACLSWSDPVSCHSGFCNQDGQSCGDCQNNCQGLNTTRCINGKYNICSIDGSGCLGWDEDIKCDSGYCSDDFTCAICPVGYANCNDNGLDGCETNLSNTTAHCGQCGNYCGVHTVCEQKTCKCSTLYYMDCDNEPGCEVNKWSDKENCGECNLKCGVMNCSSGTCICNDDQECNANAKCIDRTCSCLTGYRNANNDWSDGCEDAN